jgi:hypothetical protein
LGFEPWFQIRKYFGRKFKDTFENWQSEFLQLIWQVGGLTYLWYIGSPQSKEEEEKSGNVTMIIKRLDPQSEEFLKEMEEKYPKK